ncbi:MAG TPA: MFS transporter [Dehalococcoidia bacterium]|nr:MFS transporter [Dehalococcoidia bacterium]
MKPRAESGGTFYGWYIVGALFFATFLAIGTRQSFGVFVETWEEEWEVSVGTISIAASIGWLLNGFAQPFFGRMSDRSGGRSVVVLSLCLVGFGLLAMSLVQNVIMLAVIYGVVISVGTGGISPGITGAMASRWFTRRRGVAISLLVSGGSVGGLVLVPFLTYLFLATTWQTAWIVAGAIALGLGVPLVWMIVRSDPSEMGLLADGDAQPDAAAGPARPPAQGPLATSRWQDSFRSRPIWQLSLAYWVCGVTTASVSVHFVRWASDEGISPGTAALAFGLLSGINAVSVIVVGTLSDRMERKFVLCAVYAIRAAAFVAIVVLPGSVAIWAFAVIAGGSWLATVPLTSSLTADIYGIRNLGMLGGMINMTHQIGGALAVVIFGLVFDLSGTYDIAFTASAVLLVAASITVLGLRERRFSARYLVEPEPVLAAGGGS